jgi:hypothetical protein
MIAKMSSPPARPAISASAVPSVGDKFSKTRSEPDRSGKRAIAKKIMISSGCPSWIFIEPCASLRVLISCGLLREFPPFGWPPNFSVTRQTAKSTYCGRSRPRRWTPQLGGKRAYEGSGGPECAPKPPFHCEPRNKLHRLRRKFRLRNRTTGRLV